MYQKASLSLFSLIVSVEYTYFEVYLFITAVAMEKPLDLL